MVTKFVLSKSSDEKEPNNIVCHLPGNYRLDLFLLKSKQEGVLERNERTELGCIPSGTHS